MDKSRNLSCQGKPGKELKKRTKESRQTPERGPRRLGRRIRGQRGMFRTHLVRPLLPFPGAASCRSRSAVVSSFHDPHHHTVYQSQLVRDHPPHSDVTQQRHGR
ncbi:uncharacterized protein ACWYII_045176 isoform 1-T1 [Salvelinus alpinus]